MPRETFTVTIDTLGYVSEKNAVADASAYLAYCDQTDTFAYAPSLEEVQTLSDEDGPYAVAITFTTDIENDDHLKSFIDEMTHLSRVKSVERGVTA